MFQIHPEVSISDYAFIIFHTEGSYIIEVSAQKIKQVPKTDKIREDKVIIDINNLNDYESMRSMKSSNVSRFDKNLKLKEMLEYAANHFVPIFTTESIKNAIFKLSKW